MGAITYLIFKSECPACGGVHDVHVQVSFAQWQRFGFEEVRVGRRVPIADLGSRYITVVAPEPDEPIRLLDEEYRCGAESLWIEVVLRDDVVESAALVRMTTHVLQRLHYLPGATSVFWSWVSKLRPDEWNEDVLFTRDRMRLLRNALLLREPLRARNRYEVGLFLETFGCTPTGELTCVDSESGLWTQACHGGPENWPVPLTLLFDLEDPGDEEDELAALPGGPSEILPADVFRRKADELAARVPVYPADLETADRAERARRDLGQAIVYLRQLRYYIEPGADRVARDAIWGDDPRAVYDARPDRYLRQRIDATLARWTRELERFGTREQLIVRTADEAYVLMALHPCPSCGASTPHLQSRIEARDGMLVTVHEGPCGGCESPRRFQMNLADETVESPDEVSLLGSGRSRCLDPGQLLAASDLFSHRGDSYSLELAAACLDEALKFVPEGAERVPEDAITSRAGWAVYDAEPGRFDRARIAAVRDMYRKLSGGA